MFNLTEFDKAFLNTQRKTRTDLMQAHHAVHEFVCSRQDDRCTLSADDAQELLRLMHSFALVQLNVARNEYTAVSFVDPDRNGNDLLYACLITDPDENGRFETCSASDTQRSFL